MEETVPKSLRPRERTEAKIREALKEIIDPGTGLDVIRMGLVKKTRLEKKGNGFKATLTFRPSSPVCPMAFKLAWDMKQCAAGVDSVDSVEIEVEGYDRAAELQAILKEEGTP